jgi:hypothetical protein
VRSSARDHSPCAARRAVELGALVALADFAPRLLRAVGAITNVSS